MRHSAVSVSVPTPPTERPAYGHTADMRGIHWCWFGAAVVACGARSQISGGGSLDASIVVDATPPGLDSSTDALDAEVVCTTPTVKVGMGGGANCKFDIEWTCGDTKYRVGGACDPPADGGFAGSGSYAGVCDVNGQQVSTFQQATTSCACDDPGFLATLAEHRCDPSYQQ